MNHVPSAFHVDGTKHLHFHQPQLELKIGASYNYFTNRNLALLGDKILNIWQYFRGIAVSKSITAILFVFCPGQDTDRAALNSCTGWVKHMGRFHESRTYEFVLDTYLSKGNAEVILLDARKQPLLKLNQEFSTGKINLDATKKYYLRWEFQSATGRCELRWQAA